MFCILPIGFTVKGRDCFCSEKNPAVYPYGGVPDNNRYMSIMGDKSPLNFFPSVNFIGTHFNETANFSYSNFDSDAVFNGSQFNGEADFRLAHFYQRAEFMRVHFCCSANFWYIHFDSLADFRSSHFSGAAKFNFSHFTSIVDFSNAQFDTIAEFVGTHFTGIANFNKARFSNLADFRIAQFDGVADFRNALMDTLLITRAVIRGIFLLGSNSGQHLDFTRGNFYPPARVELHDLVEIKMQAEKLKYISLSDTLNYFLKKDIIQNLKDKSFKDDKGTHFELDYIFSKSIMYQDQTGEYKTNRWYQIRKWPKWFINTLYDLTMGLGYRPFRLILWALGIVIVYTGIFMRKIRSRINEYINLNFESKQNLRNENEEKPPLSFWESLLNCAYFSVMMFFTFRLKGNLLTFFNGREKRLVVSEWLLGFFVYIAFLTLSKAGSILHNLKELFVG